MSYTLRQVQPLLTKPELELFQSSRAAAVRTLSERQLASRIKRARTQRDKYRDLFRRQTVQSRARAGSADANRRTEQKAEIMADLLERFEAQLAKQQAQAAKMALKASPGKAATQKAVAKKAVTKKAAATQPVAKSGAAKTGAVKQAMAKKAPAKKAPAKKAVVKKAVARKAAASAGAAPAVPSRKTATGRAPAARGTRSQAVVAAGARAAARGAVPTDMTAKTARMNPLKAKPINKKIHASARARQKVHTAKRDAR